MKTILIAGCACVLAAALSACNTLNPLAVDPKLDPVAQKSAADAKAYFDKALADRLPYCQITATGKLGVSLSATPGANNDLSGSITCDPKPWSVAPASATLAQ